jgi:hypothetical protein
MEIDGHVDLPRSLAGSDRIADDRAGHAVAAAAASAEFGTLDGDDLDAGAAQKRVGVKAVLGGGLGRTGL